MITYEVYSCEYSYEDIWDYRLVKTTHSKDTAFEVLDNIKNSEECRGGYVAEIEMTYLAEYTDRQTKRKPGVYV